MEILNYLEKLDLKTIDDAIDNLRDQLNKTRKEMYSCRKKLEELQDEKWKDKQLEDMKAKLKAAVHEKMNGFPLTDEQIKDINEWIKQHDTKVHNNPNMYHGASGGGYEYVFYPTGLGVAGKCICSSCKAKALHEKGANYYARLKQLEGVYCFQELQ